MFDKKDKWESLKVDYINLLWVMSMSCYLLMLRLIEKLMDVCGVYICTSIEVLSMVHINVIEELMVEFYMWLWPCDLKTILVYYEWRIFFLIYTSIYEWRIYLWMEKETRLMGVTSNAVLYIIVRGLWNFLVTLYVIPYFSNIIKCMFVFHF